MERMFEWMNVVYKQCPLKLYLMFDILTSACLNTVLKIMRVDFLFATHFQTNDGNKGPESNITAVEGEVRTILTYFYILVV